MASVFVSHSSQDRAVTEQVAERLRAAGFAALFVDFDPDQGIPAGRNWERELYAQLRRTDAVIFLASEASVASRWCFAELSLARSLGRPVFPLRLQPGVALPLLADVQWTDLTDPKNAEAGLARLLAGLRSAGLDPADSFAWDPHRSPYPGLAPFAPEDAAVFFGRQPETHRLVELLTPTLQRGPGRLVAVVGPSGSGKSSLVHAGLLPRLARQPERWLVVPPLRPGRQPTAALAGCLARAFANRGHPRPAEELAAVLERGPAGLVEVAGQLADLGANGAGRPGVLVVVDQAEELLTRTGAREQQAFLELLGGALHEDSPVWAVATVRSEFLSTAPDRAGLAEALDDPLVIEPLSRARLAEVIARPAQRAGLEFAPGLVERMVEDTAGGDALPLLGYTLHELHQRTGREGRITDADYDAVGGVVGALRHRADRLTDELDRRGLGSLMLPTLMRLASVTGEKQPTRRRVRRSSFTPEEQAVVDAFVDAALLVSDHDPADPNGEAMVEVAHEALLRQWPPLRDAIEANRGLLRLRSELERLAADWQHGRRDDSYLLRGGRLAAIDHWAAQYPGELGPLEQEFLEASRALATRELAATRRSVRRLRALAGGLALLLVIALVTSILALNATREAQAQTRLAQSATREAQAQTRLAQSQQLARDAQDAAAVVNQYWTNYWTDYFTGSYTPPKLLPGSPSFEVPGLYDSVPGLYDSNVEQLTCGQEDRPPLNAWYCGEEDYIVADYNFLSNQDVGDSFIWLVFAHEWGHAVQARLDLPYRAVAAELQADCLAGAALAGAAADGLMEWDAGDDQELFNALNTLEDETPWTDPDSHGSTSQRVDAYNHGVQNGPNGCLPQQ